MKQKANQPMRAAHLEAMAEAALGGHELGEWEQVENGWQVVCKLCKSTTWIGENGLRYSLLGESCSDVEETDAENR